MRRGGAPYDQWPMPEGDTIRYAARRVGPALVGHEIRFDQRLKGLRVKSAVYDRAGLPCPRCNTGVRARGQGEHNRTTFWCPRCQA